MQRKAPPILLVATFLLALATHASPQTLVKRINCGDGAVSVPGAVFDADVPYQAGVQAGFVGGQAADILNIGLGPNGEFVGGDRNTRRPVYRRARVGFEAYRFDVPNGDYIVRLLAAEILDQGAGIREMTIRIEGATAVAGLDLAAEYGVQFGAELGFLVTVADGRLDVEAVPGVEDPTVDGPLLSGIEVWTAPAVFPGPAAVTVLVAKGGYHRNILAWDWNGDPTVTAFQVSRGDSAAGPFAPIATVSPAPAQYYDDGAVVGQEHFYTVAAIDAGGNVGPAAAPVPATAADIASSGLRVYDIDISPANLEQISRDILVNRTDEAVATFRFDGASYPAEVRFRGGSGRTFGKKSWKVKFDAKNRFEGRREFNLKAHFIEPAMIRERLAFRLWNDMGQPGSVIRPVALRVNGEYLGVFNEVEQIDEEFLRSRGRDPGGSIYKVESDLRPLADPSLFFSLYEKKTNTDTSHQDVIDLLVLLNTPPTPTFERDLLDIFDIDGFLSYLAVVAYIGDIDSIFHNYHLIHDLDLDRWEIVPYDSDVNFALVPQIAALPILIGTSFINPVLVNQLRERVLTIPSLLWRFTEKCREMTALYANPAHLGALTGEFHGDIREAGKADPFKFGWENDSLFLNEVQTLGSFFPVRTAQVNAEAVAFQPPAPPTVIWINELMAADHDTITDENGDYEDYVELYNSASIAIDVGGFYLTDDLSEAPTWQIPAGTVIPAGGHLVIFTDNDPEDGPLHTPFALSAGGEELGLFAPDGTTILDFISFRPQRNGVAFGRRADGAQLWRYLPTPTPGAANVETGNMPPFLAWVRNSPTIPMSATPAVVTALVRDADGLASVTLHHRIAGGSFQSVPMTPIGSDRWEATIPAQPDGTVVEYWVEGTDTLGSSAAEPRSAPDDVFDYRVTDPNPNGIEINEFLARNDTGITDERGATEDWVEIYNDNEFAMDVGGMYLTDNFNNPDKWQIPFGTIIGAKECLFIWTDDQPQDGPLHATFKLDGDGEELGLFDVDGVTMVDGFAFGSQEDDVSQGRLPDGGTTLFRFFQPSPGAPNVPGEGQVLGFDTVEVGRNTILLTAADPPVLDSVVSFDVTEAGGYDFGVLLVGRRTRHADLGTHGVSLVKSPLFYLTRILFTNGHGEDRVSFYVPDHPSLIGETFYFQGNLLFGGATQAVAVTIGP